MACALLYNFKDAARLQKVRFALFKLGVSGRVVAPEELSQPIGYLCDLEGFSPVEEPVEGGFSDEMLVLCGLSGPQLDAVARSQMWALGYNYGHGTGHGVGAAMNVHEGPISFGNRGITSGVPFEPGMVISDEPGYYKTGGFGIRIENCVTVREAFENENGRFLGFEPLTLAPIETKLVEVSLLSDQELEWLNGYHAHVLEKVLPLLEGEDARWLAEKCRPLTR